MRRSYLFAATLAALVTFVVAFAIPAAANTVCAIFNGCTGTGAIPSYGQLLVGNSSSGYTLMSTSSLGITGSGGSSFSTTSAAYWLTTQSTTNLAEGSNLYFTNGRAVTALTGQNISIFANNAGYLTSLAGAASSTLLGDSNTFSGVEKFTSASSDFGGTWQTFSPSHFQTALTLPLSTSNGGTGASSLTGLITTADLASSNISQFTNNSGYLTTNQAITLSGDESGSGSTAITTAFNLANSHWWTARQNFTNASTSQLTATTSIVASYLTAGQLVATDANDKLVSTTTIGASQVSGLTTTNFTSANISQWTNDSGYVTSSFSTTSAAYWLTLNQGAAFSTTSANYWKTQVTFTGASSTLLGDNNTFSGTDIFNNTVTGSVSGNAGTATKLATARAINNVNFDGTAAITINAASSTLLGDNNTYSASSTFSKTTNLNYASTSLLTAVTEWIPGLGTPAGTFLAVDPNGKVIATSTPAVGGGGTVTSVAATNGIVGGAITTTGTLYLTNFLATSTGETDGQLPYWTTTNGTPAKLGSVATGSISVSGGITATANQYVIGSGLTIGCTTATGSVPGCISAGDWSRFNSATTTFSAPLSYTQSTNAVTCPTCLTANQAITLSGDITGSGATAITTAFNLANSHWWIATQNFTNASTSEFTASSSVWLTGITAGSLLATDANQKLVATTTISNALLQASGVSAGSCTNCNLTYTAQGIVTAASNGSGASVPGDPFYHPSSTQSATTTLLLLNGQATTSEFTATSSVWFTSLGTPAGTFLAVDPNGKLIATSTLPVSPATSTNPLMATYDVATSTTATSTFPILNGQFYANAFSGADIGAQINAAYAQAATGSVITVGPGTYSFSTQIAFTGGQKYVTLQCSPGTVLNYTGSATSTLININADIGTTGTHTYSYGINGCHFTGPSDSGNSAGIEIGGTNGAEGLLLQNITVNKFGIGLAATSSTWVINVNNSGFSDNGQNFVFEVSHNSGERFNFTGDTFADSPTTATVGTCVNLEAGIGSAFFSNDSFDGCAPYISSGGLRVSFTNDHFENTLAGQYPYIYIATSSTSNVNVSNSLMLNDSTSAGTNPPNFIWNAGTLQISDVTVNSNGGQTAANFVHVSNGANMDISSLVNLNTAYTCVENSIGPCGTQFGGITPFMTTRSNSWPFTIGTNSSNDAEFWNGGNEAMQLDANGNLTLGGGTIPSFGANNSLDVPGQSVFSNNMFVGSGAGTFWNPLGTFTRGFIPGTNNDLTFVPYSSAGTTAQNNIYFDPTGDAGFGSSTPMALLSLSANSGTNYPGNNLFTVSSSTASATTTLFNIANNGAITQGGGATSTFSGPLLVGASTTYPYLMIGSTTPLVTTLQGNFFNIVGNDNTTNGIQGGITNISPGTSAYSFWYLNNDVSNNSATHYGGFQYNSSKYTDTTFGTAIGVPQQLSMWATDGPLTFVAASSTSANAYISFLTGGSNTGNEAARISSSGNFGLASTTPWAKLSLGSGAIVVAEASSSDYTTADVNVNFQSQNTTKIEMNANTTVNLYNDGVPGEQTKLIACQDSTGSRTLTWLSSTTLIWTGHTVPTVTATAKECDIYSFVVTGATGTPDVFGAATQAF